MLQKQHANVFHKISIENVRCLGSSAWIITVLPLLPIVIAMVISLRYGKVTHTVIRMGTGHVAISITRIYHVDHGRRGTCSIISIFPRFNKSDYDQFIFHLLFSYDYTNIRYNIRHHQ